jgi:hypothetical protein
MSCVLAGQQLLPILLALPSSSAAIGALDLPEEHDLPQGEQYIQVPLTTPPKG